MSKAAFLAIACPCSTNILPLIPSSSLRRQDQVAGVAVIPERRWVGAKHDTQCDADEEGNKVRFVQLLERVAEGGGCFVDIGVATNDLQDVAESQPQARHGRHLDVGTTDPGYGDSKALAKIEFADGFAEHVAACYNHAAEGDVAFGEDEVFIAALTNDTLELIDHGTSTDDCESVVAMNDGRVPWRHVFPGRGARGKS
jgi:hypothetical protein